MNIFLLSPGLGVYSIQLAQGLSIKDHVAIALDSEDAGLLRTEFPGFFSNSKLEIIAFPHFVFPDARKFLQMWRIYRKIVQHKPDVLHILVSGTYVESFLAVWMAHKKGIPLVATLHDTKIHPGDFIRIHSTWLNFKALEMCSQIIVHGRHLADDLMTSFGIDDRYVNIIPHGNYDIYRQASGAAPASTPNPGQVLLFGRMKKYKGIDILMKAAPIVAQSVPGLKIILAGRGPELDRFEPYLKSLPYFEVRNRYIPASETAELFSGSSLIVIPYIEASQSGPLHLAYTWGRPVVATKVGAIPESLEDGREGLLVPPNDPVALAEAMIKVLSSPQLAHKFGCAGRIKAETKLKWETEISDKTRVVYQKAMRIKNDRISYPSISSKERWKRIKTHYYRELKNDRER